MRDAISLELHFNKFTNTLRLLGYFLLLTGLIGVVFYRLGGTVSWDLISVLLLMLVLVGAIFITIGEILWKLLLVHSETKIRRFYFKDEE